MLNALFYPGLFANRVPVLRGKCPFRLVLQIVDVNTISRELHEVVRVLDQLGQRCRLSHSRTESVPCASEASTLRICLS